jgi:hypothetical protein
MTRLLFFGPLCFFSLTILSAISVCRATPLASLVRCWNLAILLICQLPRRYLIRQARQFYLIIFMFHKTDMSELSFSQSYWTAWTCRRPNGQQCSVADPDPGSGAFFHPWIRDPELEKNPDPG